MRSRLLAAGGMNIVLHTEGMSACVVLPLLVSGIQDCLDCGSCCFLGHVRLLAHYSVRASLCRSAQGVAPLTSTWRAPAAIAAAPAAKPFFPAFRPASACSNSWAVVLAGQTCQGAAAAALNVSAFVPTVRNGQGQAGQDKSGRNATQWFGPFLTRDVAQTNMMKLNPVDHGFCGRCKP